MWLWEFKNKIPIYPIFFLLKVDYNSLGFWVEGFGVEGLGSGGLSLGLRVEGLRLGFWGLVCS